MGERPKKTEDHSSARQTGLSPGKKKRGLQLPDSNTCSDAASYYKYSYSGTAVVSLWGLCCQGVWSQAAWDVPAKGAQNSHHVQPVPAHQAWPGSQEGKKRSTRWKSSALHRVRPRLQEGREDMGWVLVEVAMRRLPSPCAEAPPHSEGGESHRLRAGSDHRRG